MLIVSLVLIQVVITGKQRKIPTKSQLEYLFKPKYLLHRHIIAFSLEILPPWCKH
jgi:hypothetical protein